MKIKISITLDADVLEYAREEAEFAGYSISQFINQLIRLRMRRRKK
jgi:hypothetical protein